MSKATIKVLCLDSIFHRVDTELHTALHESLLPCVLVPASQIDHKFCEGTDNVQRMVKKFAEGGDYWRDGSTCAHGLIV